MQHAHSIVFVCIWTDSKMYDFLIRKMNNLVICNLNFFRFNAIQDHELRSVNAEMMSGSWVKNSNLSRYIFNLLSSNLHSYLNFEHCYSIFYLDWFSSLSHKYVLRLLILISQTLTIWLLTWILDSTAAFIMIWLFTMWAFLLFWLIVKFIDLTFRFIFLISFLFSWKWHWRFDFHVSFNIQNWMSINKISDSFCFEFYEFHVLDLFL